MSQRGDSGKNATVRAIIMTGLMDGVNNDTQTNLGSRLLHRHESQWEPPLETITCISNPKVKPVGNDDTDIWTW
jgi:hypothetical protein